MPDKTALIIGVTGQDGAYLSAFLLGKGYRVHGVRRRSSVPNTARLASVVSGGLDADGAGDVTGRFHLHHGDVTDPLALLRLIRDISPDEIYNLAAQSDVGLSFRMANFTGAINGLGSAAVLDVLRTLPDGERISYVQASTSEMFGTSPPPQSEDTPFQPQSPYAAAKLYAYWMTAIYRKSWGLAASNAIMFNHESPMRGEAFVTRKVSRAVAAIERGVQETLFLGNLDAERDWGHARDYAEGLWRLAQHRPCGDYVLATGESHSVRALVEVAFACIGREIEWHGQGVEEIGLDRRSGRRLVAIDSACFRPSEVPCLSGDASRARADFGWQPRTTFNELIAEMVQADLAALAARGDVHDRSA